MINWFHKLMNPHCPDCIQEREASRRCNSCEILQIENERLHIENEKLLDKLLSSTEMKITKDEVKHYDPKELEKVNRRFIPWNIRRQMLEAEDRNSARILRQNKANAILDKPAQSVNGVAELERELEINNDTSA